jgi:hypothetical protein
MAKLYEKRALLDTLDAKSAFHVVFNTSIDMRNFEQAKHVFLNTLESNENPFSDTLAFIDQWYEHTPCAFTNGNVANSENQNQGSCKVLAFAIAEGLTDLQALQCFGEHYRDVIATPNVDNHHNLRRLLKDGLVDISFDGTPLKRRA